MTECDRTRTPLGEWGRNETHRFESSKARACVRRVVRAVNVSARRKVRVAVVHLFRADIPVIGLAAVAAEAGQARAAVRVDGDRPELPGVEAVRVVDARRGRALVHVEVAVLAVVPRLAHANVREALVAARRA